MAEIEFRVLGPLTVLVNGAPVDLTSGKQRALLGLLALRAGQVLSVDRIVDDLWGERPPVTARHALQVHVSNLRKVLGPAAPATQRPGYVLRVPPESCDAARFEVLAAAGRQALRQGRPREAATSLSAGLELWRGPALADLLFEPYAAQAAMRLEELRLTATEDRLVADLELGRHAELVGEIEGLVGRHPLRERLWGLLMLASYRSGRQVEALRAYQTVRDRLRDELGLDPGPELQQLESAILRQEPSLAAPTLEPERLAGPEPTRGPAQVPAASGPASRRLATVLVAGLVGFDQVARTLDPEDLSALLDRCVGRLADVVVRYGGTIDNVVGGEVMAVFGAPVAHEDDPERAVRAAAALQRAVHDHAADIAGLELRVGICTGEVLFAASGPPGRRQPTVLGEVVNQARGLQASVAAGAVLVDPATYAATRSVVEFEQLTPTAFAIVEVAPVKQTRPLGLAPFLGRAPELDLLVGVWRRTVRERRPHLVSILGEPGVGKSRQVAELVRHVLPDGRVLRGRCLPYGESLSYAPLAEALREAAGATPDDPIAVAREKLGTTVRSLFPPQEADESMGRHLALLTGLDDESDRAGGLLDERTLHASTRRFLEAMARDRPLCLVLEDAHWADDALLDLVQAIGRRARGVPLMLITVARSELVERRTDWGGGLAAFTSVLLEPLDEVSTRALVVELGKAHGQPDALLAEIATRSGGNPLFAEELVATVAEGGATTGVPASLTSLLLARLDALPAEQQLALRRASVMGMTFWPGAVAALEAAAPRALPSVDLMDTLADLEHRDLLRVEPRSSLAGQTEYSFKHVLIRDAAYDSIPRRQRRQLHYVAADWLSAAAGDRVGEFSYQLAHHAVQSAQPDRALEFVTTAADRSRRAAAHHREAALLDDARALAVSLGMDTLVVGELHARRGRALSRVARWAEARAELEAALEVLPDESPGQLRRRAEVHCDLSTACFWLFDTVGIGEHARAALQIAERIDARDAQLAARAQITNADSSLGNVECVLSGGRDLIADARAWGLEPPYERLGTYSLQLYLTGDATTAIDVAGHAVRTGRKSGDTHGALWNMPHMGIAAAAAGRYDEAVTIFEEARKFGEEYELAAALTRCIAMSAGFHLDLFDFAGAEAIQMEARDLGRTHFNPSAVSAGLDLMFTFTRSGETEKAALMLDEVAAEVMQGQGWHGWLWRLRLSQLQAEIASARGNHIEAAVLARVSREQSKAKHRGKYEAYARVTLARSLAVTGSKQEGLNELYAAVAIARRLANPALYVMIAADLLELEPDDEVAMQARASVDRVLAHLSDPVLRERFLRAQPVRTVASA